MNDKIKLEDIASAKQQRVTAIADIEETKDVMTNEVIGDPSIFIADMYKKIKNLYEQVESLDAKNKDLVDVIDTAMQLIEELTVRIVTLEEAKKEETKENVISN